MATQLQEVEQEIEVDTRDFDAEARQQGWTPKDEFKGDPEKWIDAEAFVSRGETVMPLLKKQVQSQKGEIDFLKRQVKKLTKLEQRAYDNALTDLKAKQAEAVEFGDIAAFKQIDKQLDDLRADMAPEPAAKGEDPTSAFVEFREANEWYDLGGLQGASADERRARALADRTADKLAAQGLQKELSPSEFFARVAEEVREQMPMIGGEAKAARVKPASDVAGVTRGAARSNAKTGANLPADAKAQAKRFFEKGIIKAKDVSEAYDKFAKDYAWE